MVLDFEMRRADYHETISFCSVPVIRSGHDAIGILALVKTILTALLREPMVGMLSLAYENDSNCKLLNDMLLGKPVTRGIASLLLWIPAEAGGGWKITERFIPIVFVGSDFP